MPETFEKGQELIARARLVAEAFDRQSMRDFINELATALEDQRRATLAAEGNAELHSTRAMNEASARRETTREAMRMEAAIRWALGERDDFPTRRAGDGAYWWRSELRRRAFNQETK